MRKVLLLMLLGVIAIGQIPAIAQTDSVLDNVIQNVRADLKKDKVAIVGDNMSLTADQAAKFWPIYKEYEAEFTKVGDNLLALIEDYAANYGMLTNSKAAQLWEGMLRLEQQRLDLRKKYCDRLSKELSSIVAAQFLQVDNRINLLIDLQIAGGVPLISKGK